jgi:hypothetical protein
LVIQQDPRLRDRELPFFDLGKRETRPALTFRVTGCRVTAVRLVLLLLTSLLLAIRTEVGKMSLLSTLMTRGSRVRFAVRTGTQKKRNLMMNARRHIGVTTLQHVIGVAESPGVIVVSVELRVAELLEVGPVLGIGAPNESIGQRKLLGLLVILDSGISMSVARSHGGQDNRIDNVYSNLIHDRNQALKRLVVALQRGVLTLL